MKTYIEEDLIKAFCKKNRKWGVYFFGLSDIDFPECERIEKKIIKLPFFKLHEEKAKHLFNVGTWFIQFNTKKEAEKAFKQASTIEDLYCDLYSPNGKIDQH